MMCEVLNKVLFNLLVSCVLMQFSCSVSHKKDEVNYDDLIAQIDMQGYSINSYFEKVVSRSRKVTHEQRLNHQLIMNFLSDLEKLETAIIAYSGGFKNGSRVALLANPKDKLIIQQYFAFDKDGGNAYDFDMKYRKVLDSLTIQDLTLIKYKGNLGVSQEDYNLSPSRFYFESLNVGECLLKIKLLKNSFLLLNINNVLDFETSSE